MGDITEKNAIAADVFANAKMRVHLLADLKNTLALQEKIVEKYRRAKEIHEKLSDELNAARGKQSKFENDIKESAGLAKRTGLHDEVMRQFNIAVIKTKNDISAAQENRSGILLSLDPSQSKEQQAAIKESYKKACEDIAKLEENYKTLCVNHEAQVNQASADEKRQKVLSAEIMIHKLSLTLTPEAMEELETRVTAAEKAVSDIADAAQINDLNDKIPKDRQVLSAANHALVEAQHALARAAEEHKNEELAQKRMDELAAKKEDAKAQLENMPTIEELDAKVNDAQAAVQSAEQEEASIQASLQRITDYEAAKKAHDNACDKFYSAEEKYHHLGESISLHEQEKTKTSREIAAARQNKGILGTEMRAAKEITLETASKLEAVLQKLSPKELDLFNHNSTSTLESQLLVVLEVKETAVKAYKKAVSELQALHQLEKNIGRGDEVAKHVLAAHTNKQAELPLPVNKKAPENFFTKAFRIIKEAFNSVKTFVKNVFNGFLDTVRGNKSAVDSQNKSVDKNSGAREVVVDITEKTVVPELRVTHKTTSANDAKDPHFFHSSVIPAHADEKKITNSNAGLNRPAVKF